MKKIIYAAFFLLLLLTAIGGTYALGRWLFFAPQNLSTEEKINLLIKSGDSLYNLAPELKAANLIRSVFAFKLYHWLFTSQIPLQAGTLFCTPRCLWHKFTVNFTNPLKK